MLLINYFQSGLFWLGNKGPAEKQKKKKSLRQERAMLKSNSTLVQLTFIYLLPAFYKFWFDSRRQNLYFSYGIVQVLRKHPKGRGIT